MSPKEIQIFQEGYLKERKIITEIAAATGDKVIINEDELLHALNEHLSRTALIVQPLVLPADADIGEPLVKTTMAAGLCLTSTQSFMP